jgi:hypothetical protein
MIAQDPSLQELAVTESWTPHLNLDYNKVDDFKIYRKICFKVYELR